MGVPETLKRLGPLMKEANLWQEARGRVVGFDGHVFLHHFVYAVAADIVTHNNYKPLAKMFRQRCQQILGHGVTPIIVFDGGRLPAKHTTDQARAEARARAYARHQLNADPADQALVAAGRLGSQAVRAVIEELCEHGIAHVVAPYEADVQLAWMSEKNIIWAAVTVDSDFVMHGVKRIFYKVDYHFGNCYLVDMASVLDSSLWPSLPVWKTDFLDLLAKHRMSFLLAYALCAGCDYDTKVKNIGPKRAIAAIKSLCNSSDFHFGNFDDRVLRQLAEALRDKGGNGDDLEHWPHRAADALVVFKNGLVYDLTRKAVVTKTDGEACHSACARWPFLGAAITPEDAHMRARGTMAPDGSMHELPALSLLATFGMPDRLTVDMIPGATLPANPAAWTVPQLKLWLHTRHGMGDIGLSSARRATLVDVVRRRQELEEEWEARGELVRLRDPSGRSLEAIILMMNPQQGWHFPGQTQGIQLPIEGWISDQATIRREAPAITSVVWLKHWQHVTVHGSTSSKTILEDASSRMKEMTTLMEFCYHPQPALPPVHESNQETVVFKLFVPASMRDENHRVWVEVSVCRIEGLPPAALDVVRAGCSCAIGSSGQCVHVAIVLMTVHNLEREGDMEVVVPVTSVLCRWNDPGNGPMYDVTMPMCKLPFLMESRVARRDDPARQDRQDEGRYVAQCSSNTGHRARYIPLADKDLDKLMSERDHPARIQLRLALFTVRYRELGEPSAAEYVWGDVSRYARDAGT